MRRTTVLLLVAVAGACVITALVFRGCRPAPAPTATQIADAALATEADHAEADQDDALHRADSARAVGAAHLADLERQLADLALYNARRSRALDSLTTRLHALPPDSLAHAARLAFGRRTGG